MIIGHPSVMYRLSLGLKLPVFIARQLVKHQTGLVWNESAEGM